MKQSSVSVSESLQTSVFQGAKDHETSFFLVKTSALPQDSISSLWLFERTQTDAPLTGWWEAWQRWGSIWFNQLAVVSVRLSQCLTDWFLQRLAAVISPPEEHKGPAVDHRAGWNVCKHKALSPDMIKKPSKTDPTAAGRTDPGFSLRHRVKSSHHTMLGEPSPDTCCSLLSWGDPVLRIVLFQFTWHSLHFRSWMLK